MFSRNARLKAGVSRAALQRARLVLFKTHALRAAGILNYSGAQRVCYTLGEGVLLSMHFNTFPNVDYLLTLKCENFYPSAEAYYFLVLITDELFSCFE